MTRPEAAARPQGILDKPYRLVSIGACALIVIAAFEQLAVTTIMPAIARDLDGLALYALAFAGPLASGVIGMVLAGDWSDRRGPVKALYASVALFALGLVIAGTAPTMPIFLAGRLVQGLGGGALTVALYVIVAKIYPPRLQPKIFGAFAAAWVVPALVGPFIAGVVGQYLGWRWVFLGVVVLVLPAMAMVLPAMRSMAPHDRLEPDGRSSTARALWAVLLAVAILGLNIAADLDGVARWVLATGGLAVALVALRPLLPAASLRLRRGLPSVIAMRGLLAGAFMSAEVYLPYVLTERFGLTAALAGLALSFSGVAWGSSSLAQGRLGDRVSHRTAIRIGILGATAAIGVVLLVTALELPAWVIIGGWFLGGAGMGFAYPRITVLTFDYSTPAEQGFNSSALAIADSGGSAIALALGAVAFSVAGAPGSQPSFVATFAFSLVAGILALIVSARVSQRPRRA
ncbi:MFS transporter [Agreia pratensis]|uniref:MFS transporter n=1 Tax=Agreia pratensis TaxID=150121 RepID=UPI001E3710CA|nr:MFS transporter [Agreia pratensis]